MSEVLLAEPLEQPEAVYPVGSLVTRQVWQEQMATANGSLDKGPTIKRYTLNSLFKEDPEKAYDALVIATREGSAGTDEPTEMGQLVVGMAELYDDLGFPETVSAKQIFDDERVQAFIAARSLKEVTGRVRKVIRARSTYAFGLHEGMRQGYIPRFVTGRLKDALDKTLYLAIDPAAMTVVTGPGSAHYLSYDDTIGLTYDPEVDYSLSSSLVHELTHKISGGTFAEPDDNYLARRRRNGLSNIFMDKDMSTKVGINEAVNHHLTLAMLDGDFATINPEQRSIDDGIYANYRRTWARFIERSQGLVTAKDFTLASFEDTGPEGGFGLRKQLIKACVNAYGWGALNRLEKLCQLVNDAPGDDLKADLLELIRPPELDEAGEVVRPGMIDVDDISFMDLFNDPQKITDRARQTVGNS